uniref:Uncharacterized protein n=1 Tax=Anguilla anguilla TaxID=7936 RepID=A0A0E9W4S0_ANGAN
MRSCQSSKTTLQKIKKKKTTGVIKHYAMLSFQFLHGQGCLWNLCFT